MRTPGELHNTHEVVYKNLSDGASTMFAVAQIHPLVTREEAIANAEFICKAVNSHELLVAAIKVLQPPSRGYGCWCPDYHDRERKGHTEQCLQVKAALEKVGKC